MSFLEKVGYSAKCTNHFFEPLKLNNLCAYLASLLALGKISEEQAKKPNATVANKAATLRTRTYQQLRHPGGVSK